MSLASALLELRRRTTRARMHQLGVQLEQLDTDVEKLVERVQELQVECRLRDEVEILRRPADPGR